MEIPSIPSTPALRAVNRPRADSTSGRAFVVSLSRGALAKNVVGSQVRKLRWEHGLRQRDLAARLQIMGWNIDRAAVAKIESGIRCVADYELLFLARALIVPVSNLFGRCETKKR